MERVRTPLFYLFGDKRVRRNVWALLKVVLFVSVAVVVYTALILLIMIYTEGTSSSAPTTPSPRASSSAWSTNGFPTTSSNPTSTPPRIITLPGFR